MQKFIQKVLAWLGIGQKETHSQDSQPPPATEQPMVEAETPGTHDASPEGWFMYHGGYAHGGYVGTGSGLNSSTVKDSSFGLLYKLTNLRGPILSVPAVVGDYIYVGTANSMKSPSANGGSFYKIELKTGTIAHEYNWEIDPAEGDTHGFMGMGTTPSIVNGKVYFAGFDGRLYCLNQSDLSEVFVVDLRRADPKYNQPITNVVGTAEDPNPKRPSDMEDPPAAGWSSPLVVNGNIYLGIGEGESPYLYSFIYCLDAESGQVKWVFCTNQFEEGRANRVNELPASVLQGGTNPLPGGTAYSGSPVTMGSSVWSAIAYDAGTGLLYASTGNPSDPIEPYDELPDPSGKPPASPPLPTPGYSNGILALDANTGNYHAFTQVPPHLAYRPSDFDIDIGSACTLFDLSGQRVVGVGCKCGGFMVCDAQTLELINSVQLLPYQPGTTTQYPTIDPHPPAALLNERQPHVSNDDSNKYVGENYFGPFNTAAYHPASNKLFIGMGGPNYHMPSPGIDFQRMPFMKVLDATTLEDAWPTVDGPVIDGLQSPPRYQNVGDSMYTNAGESGLSSPAVVNDVVFCSTSKVAIYAFKVDDGTLLWSRDLGSETGGLNGGYGYCLGPAISGNYVVAGGLVKGLEGGVLEVYSLK